MLGISFLAATGPRDFSALTEAVLAFYDAIAQRPTEFVSLRNDSKIGRRLFTPAQFRKLVRDERIEEFHIGDVTEPDAVVVECWLRPRYPEDQRFETRWITITGTGISYGSPPVRELMKTIVSLYEIAQGCVAEYRSLAYARKECSFSGAYSPFELDPETAERLGEDQMCRGLFLSRLRRLYPVTIIGPRIWSELPAMPTFDPAPTVEELGDCKVLKAWPELVEPRDPAFLAGTVELRRWLWPYTIQNPADAVDTNPADAVDTNP